MRDWVFKADMNIDGTFTISDIYLFLKSLYFYPGDYLIRFLSNNDVGKFLEISIQDYGGFMSGFFSFFAWAYFLFLLYALFKEVSSKLLDKIFDIYLFFKKDKNT